MRDITERKQAEQERERLIEELNAFAHTVAHDLKNPSFVLTSTAHLLLANHSELSDEQINADLQAIVRGGRKLNNIIDELLLLAGVHQQQIEIEPLHMANIIAEAQQRLHHLIETHQARIKPPSVWPVALGHGPWVEEVWLNYLLLQPYFNYVE